MGSVKWLGGMDREHMFWGELELSSNLKLSSGFEPLALRASIFSSIDKMKVMIMTSDGKWARLPCVGLTGRTMWVPSTEWVLSKWYFPITPLHSLPLSLKSHSELAFSNEQWKRKRNWKCYRIRDGPKQRTISLIRYSPCFYCWHLIKGRIIQLEEDGVDGDMRRAFLETFLAQDAYC